MKVSPLPFAVWLPILDLLIWLTFFAIPVITGFVNFELASHGSGEVHINTGSFSANIPQAEFFSFALESATFRNSHIIEALNIPGTLGEVLISLPTTWPASFVPGSMTLDEWRCVIFPIFCLPAWWLVGIGLDALVGRQLIHWLLLLLGSVLLILFAVVFLGLRFGVSASDWADTAWPLWGIGLWTLLFAIFPCVWWRQWRYGRTSIAT